MFLIVPMLESSPIFQRSAGLSPAVGKLGVLRSKSSPKTSAIASSSAPDW